MTRLQGLSDEELGRRLTDELRAMSGRPAQGSAESDRILAAVRHRLRGEVPGPAAGPRLAGPAVVSLVGALSLALLVLVALFARQPAVGPAPANSSALATPPNTWSAYNERDFAEALAAGTLRGMWVVVQGAVQAPAAPLECPQQTCSIGWLASQPQVELHARWQPVLEGDRGATEREVDGVDWRWWALPRGPAQVERMVLRVGEDGAVEYVGREYEARSSWGLATLARPEYAPQIAELDEVILVPGWLVAVQRQGGCPGAPAMARAGLAGRSCGTAWLLPQPPAGGSDWAAGGVQVQDGALAGIVNDRSVIQLPGLFAVARRLESAGCGWPEDPCWQWNVVASITYQQPGPAVPVPSTSPRSSAPTAAPEQTATADPQAIELRTSARNTSGYCRTALGGGHLAVHPETGLGVGRADGTNVQPIIWPFGFTARREADGAVLLGPDGRVLAREGDQISFGGGVGTDGIFAACGSFDVRPQPSPTRSPQAPVPSELPQAELECPYSDGREWSRVSVVDRAGLVSGCVAELGPGDGDPPMIGNPQGDRGSLFVEWQAGCAGGTPARISLWPSQGPDRPPLVILELLASTEPGCPDAVVAQGVVLSISSPLDGDDVELVVMDQRVQRARAETPAGAIEMSLEGPVGPLAAGQPIEIVATLATDGALVPLSGSGRRPSFSLTQLDGPLLMEEGVSLECQDYYLEFDAMNAFHAEPFVGYDGGGPYADWYQEWSQSEQLWLPAGTWLIQAHTAFHAGSGCTGEELRLSDAMIVTVTAP